MWRAGYAREKVMGSLKLTEFILLEILTLSQNFIAIPKIDYESRRSKIVTNDIYLCTLGRKLHSASSDPLTPYVSGHSEVIIPSLVTAPSQGIVRQVLYIVSKVAKCGF